jgi:hypothetical protein
MARLLVGWEASSGGDAMEQIVGVAPFKINRIIGN